MLWRVAHSTSSGRSRSTPSDKNMNKGLRQARAYLPAPRTAKRVEHSVLLRSLRAILTAATVMGVPVPPGYAAMPAYSRLRSTCAWCASHFA